MDEFYWVTLYNYDVIASVDWLLTGFRGRSDTFSIIYSENYRKREEKLFFAKVNKVKAVV